MMTYGFLTYSIYLMVVGIFSFVSSRSHLLSMLLSLEFIVLSLYSLLFYCLSFFLLEMSVSVMFLCFSVCEGALGLSILVSIVRTHGNDYFRCFSVI